MANSGRSSGQAPIGRRGPKAGSNIAARTVPAHLNSDRGVALDACRDALAPTLHAQMEGLKAIERFGRYQYSVAGDYLEWGVAQARANLTLGTPVEHFASQTTLCTQFGEKLQGRVREFMNLASETRASFNQLLGEATARLAETIKQSP